MPEPAGHLPEREEPARTSVEKTEKKKEEPSPLILTILGAIVTGILAIANSFFQASQAHQLEESQSRSTRVLEEYKLHSTLALEQEKFRETIILKAIEPAEPEERKKSLFFYVEVGLLSDPEGKIKNLKAENIPQAPESTFVKRIGNSDIFRRGEAIVFSAGLVIDTAGAFRRYHPDGHSGLDYLPNVGQSGNWWGLVTENGTPVVQQPTDPAPGFYVSSTSLQDTSKKRTDPYRYVDSSTVPYIVLPVRFAGESGAKLGDVAAVFNEANGRVDFAVVADIGPASKIGEGSIALAEGLGIPSDPKHGGIDHGITYIVFPNSGKRWPMTLGEIRETGARLFKAWGGNSRLKGGQSSAPDASAGESHEATTTSIRNAQANQVPEKNPIPDKETTVESRVNKLILEQLGVNAEQIVPSARLVEDLGADSLDLPELIMAVEVEFNIEVPDQDAERIQTVEDLYKYIKGHMRPRS